MYRIFDVIDKRFDFNKTGKLNIECSESGVPLKKESRRFIRDLLRKKSVVEVTNKKNDANLVKKSHNKEGVKNGS